MAGSALPSGTALRKQSQVSQGDSSLSRLLPTPGVPCAHSAAWPHMPSPDPQEKFIGWANNHFNNQHFRQSLESTQTQLKWELEYV